MRQFLAKKLSTILMTLSVSLLVGVGLLSVVKAVDAPVVSFPTNLSASPGSQVTVDIGITGLTAGLIDGYALRIDFDPNILSNPVAIKTGTLSESVADDNFVSGATTDGIGRFAIGVFTGFAGSQDGTLVKVRFDVAADFTGTTPLSFAGTTGANPKTTLSKSFVTVTSTFTNGSFLAVDSAGPATSNVQISANDIAFGTPGIDLTARIDDSASGKNNATAAEFFVDTQGADGAGTAMTAVDGAFDSQTENVQAAVNTSALAVGTHTLFVHGKDAQDNWGAVQSITFTVFQAPAAPTLTTVTSPTRTVRPLLDWNDVPGAAGYDLQLSLDNFDTTVAAPAGLTVSEFTPNIDLADGTYFWRVRAFDDLNPVHTGLFSTASTFTVDTTPPATGVTVVGTGLGITQAASGDLSLTWTNPTADFEGVIVVAGDTAPTFTPVNGTTYTVGQTGIVGGSIVAVGNISTFTEAGLANGTQRFYTIFTHDSLKNYNTAGVSLNATSADTQAPAAPTGLTAASGNAQVVLTWTNPADADFAGSLVLMKQGSAPTGVPTDGTAQVVNDVIGDATVVFAGTANTATITGLTNNTTYHFAVYAFDEVPNYSAAASTSAIPGPPVISSPVLPTDVRVGDQLQLTATSGTGSFNWSLVTAGGGTLSATTGANVTWTAPATVTDSPTPVTIRVTDPDTSLFTEGTVNVFTKVAVTDKPATPPTVLPGATSATFQAGGGDSTFTWTVTGPVTVAGGTGGSFAFTAPNTGDFAGEYTIEAADSLGGTDSFKVRVPFTLDPKSKTFRKDANVTFTIRGTTGTPTFDIMSKAADGTLTKAGNAADFGTFGAAQSAEPPNGTTSSFTAATAITAAKTFFLQVTVADDTDLTSNNGLNVQTAGPFNIVPVNTYTVSVKKADGAAVEGAVVMVEPGQTSAITGTDGKATFTLPDGGKYSYEVSAATFVSQFLFSADKSVTVTLAAADATKAIKGTVRDATPAAAAMAGVEVRVYLPSDLKTQHEATTDANGAFTINLPASAAATGWTVVASKAGFVTGKLTNVNAGATGVDFSLAALTGTAPDVDAAGGTVSLPVTNGQTAMVEVPAGGLAKDAVILIAQAAKATDSKFTSASPGFVYDVKAQDTANVDLAAADIKLIVITLPLDVSVVKPGDLENNRFTIFTAATLADLEAGKVTAVPVANIISTDYVGDGTLGSVTFFVDHLSFFGVGAGSGAAGAPGDGTDCFIATAAYGSYMEKHVQILRNFRDAYLLTNKLGQTFVSFYYRHSPPVADFIAKHDILRAVVRIALTPLVGVSYVLLATTMMQKLMLLFFFTLFILGTCRIARRVRSMA